MKTETGGTQMWCSKCKEITVCKAIPTKDVNRFIASGQRFYKTKHADVHYFRRGRCCLSCGHKFLSAEAQESFLSELVELRDALAVIKRDAEQYIADSQKTATSLTSLNYSLGKLRALKIYQSQTQAPPVKAPPPFPRKLRIALKRLR